MRAQGYFEPDVAELIRARAFQQYSFGQFPAAVVFDKIDILGKTAHPLYKVRERARPWHLRMGCHLRPSFAAQYMTSQLKNPNGVERVTLNFEKARASSPRVQRLRAGSQREHTLRSNF